ncbi:MAG TPA: ATP-binding protein [Clostridia bacterium]|nr:ATP-binding protein [Clostridia bacterium]
MAKKAHRQKMKRHIEAMAATVFGCAAVCLLMTFFGGARALCAAAAVAFSALGAFLYAQRAFVCIAAALCSLVAWTLPLLRGGAENARADVFLLILMTAFSMAAGALAGDLHRRLDEQKARTSQQSTREELIYNVNTRLLSAAGMESLMNLTLQCIYEMSARPSALYVRDGRKAKCACKYPAGLILYPNELKAAQRALDTGMPTGVGTDECAFSSFAYTPLVSEGGAFAVIGVLMDVEAPPAEQTRKAIDLIIKRATVALVKQKLVDAQQQIRMETETERIRGNFLRAISHDLRSPLTAIIGACSALEAESVKLDPETRAQLIRDIEEEAAWLLRMVENLLSVTRVSADGPALKKTAEPVEEVVGEALDRAYKRFPDVLLRVDLPGELMIVPMDPTLIVQVLVNLIENAVKYGGADKNIDLRVREEGGSAVFIVRDYGRGLSESEIGSLFTPSACKIGDSTHGLGLGLSICRSVIRAHGGEIYGGNDAGGGAVFRFTLPMEVQNG